MKPWYVKIRNGKELSAALALACVMTGCATYTRPTILEPIESPGIMCFYLNGVPFGILSSDSAFVALSAEEYDLEGVTYLRVWALYKNASTSRILLEPQNNFWIELRGSPEVAAQTITPELPSKILAEISAERQAALIMQAIGGALASATAQPTTLETSGDFRTRTTVNDRSEKGAAIQGQTSMQMSLTSEVFQRFQEAINNGILRKNTLLEGAAVQGYVYFPLRSAFETASGRRDRNAFSGSTKQKANLGRRDRKTFSGSTKKTSNVPRVKPSELEYSIHVRTTNAECTVVLVPKLGE